MVDYKFNLQSSAKIIEELAQKSGLFFETTAILYSRGFDTLDKINYFLDPGKHHFKDPFTLKGMKDAVERIKQAKQDGETVAIYGDYDADGICATTVLYYSLKEFGIDAITIIPERENGYGLQIPVLDKLIEEHFPTLIITVDCGISCQKEVEYLKNEGIDVIVTDHHELPEVLPDCTVINCKIPSEFGFDSLCGAGVAYKLGVALIGEKANKFLDFTAIATIADSMPLTDENRDIVYEGVKMIKRGKCHPAISELIAISNTREVSSTSLAFTIAPRINAAGRMGDAKSALKLMTTDSSLLIEELAIKLNGYNHQRQQDCEILYKSAKQKLIDTCYNKRIVVLSDDEWNSGLVGIIAAKLVEEFSRPVILFVNNHGKLHGSARSIETINIFEAISACKDTLTDFGGHAQAAGISVSEENFEKFKSDIENYINEKYDYDLFKPKKTVEFCIDKPFSIELARELNKLEPFGTGNKKPLFSLKTDLPCANYLKPGSSHLLLKTKFIDMLYFNGADSFNLINSGTEKEIIFEPNISVFNYEESLKGYVKYIDYKVTPTSRIKLYSFRSGLLTALNDNDDYLYVSTEMTKKVVQDCLNQHYGTLFAVYNIDNLRYYENITSLDCSLYYTLNKNLVNNLVVGLNSCEVEGYKRIVYLDRPLGIVPKFDFIKETFIDRSLKAYDYARLDTAKPVFADIFKKAKTERVYATDSVDYALKNSFGYSKEQIVFTLEVFIELGIFTFKNGILKHNKEIRSSLDSSKIYNEVLKLK